MRILGLRPKAFAYGLVFTVVEIVTLVVWLVLAGLPFAVTPKHIAAVIVLAVGLFIEHTISLLAGRVNTF